jgi:hypothetical protein
MCMPDVRIGCCQGAEGNLGEMFRCLQRTPSAASCADWVHACMRAWMHPVYVIILARAVTTVAVNACAKKDAKSDLI